MRLLAHHAAYHSAHAATSPFGTTRSRWSAKRRRFAFFSVLIIFALINLARGPASLPPPTMRASRSLQVQTAAVAGLDKNNKDALRVGTTTTILPQSSTPLKKGTELPPVKVAAPLQRSQSYMNMHISERSSRSKKELPHEQNQIGDANILKKRPVEAAKEVVVVKKLETEAIVQPQIATQKLSLDSNKNKDGSLEVLIFTMDSLDVTVRNSAAGGPAGEIIVRKCLERSLLALGHTITVARSDEEFNEISTSGKRFDVYFFDQWTSFGVPNGPRPLITENKGKVFILDYFGTTPYVLYVQRLGIEINHILTATGLTELNTYLGLCYLDEPNPVEPGRVVAKKEAKVDEGVIWGKHIKYFSKEPARLLISFVLHQFPNLVLHSSVILDELLHTNLVVFDGILNSTQWEDRLARSKFLLGTGDPFLGPSGLDALRHGCLLIIPRFRYSVNYSGGLRAQTQHDFIVQHVPPEYYCIYPLEDSSFKALRSCIERALSINLPPYRLPELSFEAHKKRVEAILSMRTTPGIFSRLFLG